RRAGHAEGAEHGPAHQPVGRPRHRRELAREASVGRLLSLVVRSRDQSRLERQVGRVEERDATPRVDPDAAPVHAPRVAGIDQRAAQARRREHALVAERPELLAAAIPIPREHAESAAKAASGRSVCGTSGGGSVGTGWVGEATSPGTSEAATGRSSTGKTGLPVSRSSTNRKPVFVAATTTGISRPSRWIVVSTG